ncbi:MAG: transglycosylase SLT domain-containing protein [Bacteroidota bacterium]
MFSRPRKRTIASLLVPLVAALALVAAFRPDLAPRLLPDPIERDLDAIHAGDTLTVLSAYNSTSYFLYRGEPMGYEYDLLQRFAEDQDLVLRMQIVPRDSLLVKLLRGEGDIAAARLVPEAADSAYVRYTRALYETEPILVQRDGPPDPDAGGPIVDALDSLTAATLADSLAHSNSLAHDTEPLPDAVELRARLIQSPEELSGEAVAVTERSPFADDLVELADSISGDIEVVEVDKSTEELIRRVAAARLDFAVSPENVGRLTQSRYTNLVVRPSLGEPHRVAWGVRSNAPRLLAALDDWIASERESAFWNTTYRRYFVDRRGYRERIASTYLTGTTGTLSDYDALLRDAAAEIDWDWRLLAAQAYQESRFRPQARSWAGAQGLLQLMPATAREFGVTDANDPADNVAGAVRFLAWLKNYWDGEIADPAERLKFVLGSYNTGHGHVEDARRLAVKHGDDPDVWADVAYWLLQKSKRAVYTDPVVKYGFCRGLEPVTYVAHILERWEHYQQFVEDEASTATTASRAAS